MVFRTVSMSLVVLMLFLSFLLGRETEPVVYLEFTDFSKFMTELQQDKGYREFMRSPVLEWYENTRLGLKFPKRIKEFEDVLGFGLSLKNINTLAGKETGIWLFDIGELEMLMITNISESDYLRSRIAGSKERFGEGKIDTITFYFKKDESGNKEVDFAFLNDRLVISNEPTAFEECVRRLAAGDDFLDWKYTDFLEWMEEPIDEGYDILLYLSPESVRNTYFTSYWFHGNQDDIRKWFDRGIILLSKDEKKITEKRIYHLVEDFSFDSLSLGYVPKLFGVIPEDADMMKIAPVIGDEFVPGLRKLMGGGKAMDSLIQAVEEMQPCAFGHFAALREGEILPEIAEGIAVVVKEADDAIIEQFSDIYPEKLRSHKLFSKNMPDLQIEHDILLFSTEGGFFKKRKSLNYKDIEFYSFLDHEKFATAFASEIEILGESERWRSYENRDFFKENIGALIRISVSFTKSIEISGKVKGTNYLSSVTYTLAK